MPPRRRIFREAALQRFASPDQLDELMPLTDTNSWLGVLGFILLTALFLLWGVFGVVPTRVDGPGLLVVRGALTPVSARGAGAIAELRVQPGDTVEAGEVVALLELPGLEAEIALQQGRVDDRRRALEQILSAIDTERADRLRLQQAERGRLQQLRASAAARQSYFRMEVSRQEELLGEDLITRQQLEQTRLLLQGIEEDLARVGAQLWEVEAAIAAFMAQASREEREGVQALAEARRVLASLQARRSVEGAAVAPRGGLVLELRSAVGRMVTPGAPVLLLETRGAEGDGLRAVAYLPVSVARRVEPGMRVEVSPSTAPREEFGVVWGVVEEVSRFPTARAGMVAALDNPELVDSYRSQIGGVGLEAWVTLEASPATASGYRWSSPLGASVPLDAGTPCRVSVLVRQQSPLSLVLPALRGWLGSAA